MLFASFFSGVFITAIVRNNGDLGIKKLGIAETSSQTHWTKVLNLRKYCAKQKSSIWRKFLTIYLNSMKQSNGTNTWKYYQICEIIQNIQNIARKKIVKMTHASVHSSRISLNGIQLSYCDGISIHLRARHNSLLALIPLSKDANQLSVDDPVISLWQTSSIHMTVKTAMAHWMWTV